MEILADESGGVNAIILRNMGDFDLDIKGTVDGSEVTFRYNEAGILIEGTGTLDGNTLNITYRAEVPSFDFFDDCVVVANKQ